MAGRSILCGCCAPCHPAHASPPGQSCQVYKLYTSTTLFFTTASWIQCFIGSGHILKSYKRKKENEMNTSTLLVPDIIPTHLVQYISQLLSWVVFEKFRVHSGLGQVNRYETKTQKSCFVRCLALGMCNEWKKLDDILILEDWISFLCKSLSRSLLLFHLKEVFPAWPSCL